jgi:hypothetical protein
MHARSAILYTPVQLDFERVRRRTHLFEGELLRCRLRVESDERGRGQKERRDGQPPDPFHRAPGSRPPGWQGGMPGRTVSMTSLISWTCVGARNQGHCQREALVSGESRLHARRSALAVQGVRLLGRVCGAVSSDRRRLASDADERREQSDAPGRPWG